MDYIDAIIELASFKLAAHVALFGFLGRGDPQDEFDADTAECHEEVLAALSDADRTRTIEALTNEDLRSQLTVEDAERLSAEAAEAKRGWWRN